MENNINDFAEANKAVHKVENEWHFPIMTTYNWIADTKKGVGFVRSYKYHHPKIKNEIIVSIGVSADYWIDKTTKAQGYWRDLDPYLQKLSK